jgi:DNA-binding XRE family transcriptional regulator
MSAEMIEKRVYSHCPVFVPVDSGDDDALQFVNIIALGDRSVGSRLAGLRRSRRWSKMHLARRAGVDLESVRSAEVNPAVTPVAVFVKLCEALRVHIHDLTEELPVRVDPVPSRK